MKVHLVQFDIAWEDKATNHARVRSMLEQAPPAPGDLVVLPELFDTGFSLHVDRTSDADGASLEAVKAIATEHRVTVQGSQTVLGPSGLALNRAVVVDPKGAEVAAYDKVHPFSFGREPEAFVGGTSITAYDWGLGDETMRICPGVCYDLRFPELFREGSARGAHAFALGANWPSARTDHWATLLRARAIENQAFVFGVNRVGQDPHLSYDGRSAIIAPDGEVLADAGHEEVVLSAEIDPERVLRWRGSFPALSDARPDIYRGWADGRTGDEGR